MLPYSITNAWPDSVPIEMLVSKHSNTGSMKAELT